MAALSLNMQIGDETIEDVVQKINYFERSLVVAATSEERLALTKLLAELRARENQLRSGVAGWHTAARVLPMQCQWTAWHSVNSSAAYCIPRHQLTGLQGCCSNSNIVPVILW